MTASTPSSENNPSLTALLLNSMRNHFATTPPLSLRKSPSRGYSSSEHGTICAVFLRVILSLGATASAALLQSASSTPSLALPLALNNNLSLPLGTRPVPLSKLVKGKVLVVYTIKLTPTVSNGNVVGEKGAKGKYWAKGIKNQQGYFFVL
ncbi:unnamed protein product [Closterium sp. Yama58-4]|nr:unnamed protein product [Closterium sp. Yama58-4]